MSVKHSKYKNTGILFELLVKQITSDTLEGKPSPARDLIQKYFVKSELGKEYKLYESLISNTSLTEGKANVIISTLTDSSKTLNRSLLKRQKYNLIKELQSHYNINEFFNRRLPNYKVYAAFYTLLELNHQENIQPKQLIQNKVTILEHITENHIQESKVKDDVMEELNKSDKDIKLLTYKILLEKFNSKYDGLHPNQKRILKEYINSVDNTTRLKDFYIKEVNNIKKTLNEINKDTKDEATKLKVEGIINMIKTPTKKQQIKDDNLVDLMQYYDLVNELTLVNESV